MYVVKVYITNYLPTCIVTYLDIKNKNKNSIFFFFFLLSFVACFLILYHGTTARDEKKKRKKKKYRNGQQKLSRHLSTLYPKFAV